MKKKHLISTLIHIRKWILVIFFFKYDKLPKPISILLVKNQNKSVLCAFVGRHNDSVIYSNIQKKNIGTKNLSISETIDREMAVFWNEMPSPLRLIARCSILNHWLLATNCMKKKRIDIIRQITSKYKHFVGCRCQALWLICVIGVRFNSDLNPGKFVRFFFSHSLSII